MKTKILLFTGALILFITTYSQTDAVVVKPDGHVGIGCDPGDALFKVYKGSNPSIEIGSNISKLQVGVAANGWDWAQESQAGDAVFRTIHGGNSDRHGMIFYMPNADMDGRSYIKFGDSGNRLWFGIFNDRKVRIDGEVTAKKIMLKTDVWADDVFDKGYQLKPLSEIESYIKLHNHLPGIPCAEEVIEEGINVSEMNAVLLRKIEELTLHLIEQNKVVLELKEEINKLKND